MSLEASLEKLNGNIEKLIEQNEKILGIAASRQAAAGADTSDADTKTTAAAKKKAEAAAKKADTAGDKGVTKADLTGALAAWMNEFGKPAADGHPESAARHTALKTVLGKLGIEGGLKGVADDDQVNIDKLHNWLEKTAKTADKGFGIGRLAADPEEEKAPASDDDLGV